MHVFALLYEVYEWSGHSEEYVVWDGIGYKRKESALLNRIWQSLYISEISEIHSFTFFLFSWWINETRRKKDFFKLHSTRMYRSIEECIYTELQLPLSFELTTRWHYFPLTEQVRAYAVIFCTSSYIFSPFSKEHKKETLYRNCLHLSIFWWTFYFVQADLCMFLCVIYRQKIEL